MRTIRISNSDISWLYRDSEYWKNFCGCDDFDETYVVFGNRDYAEIKNASWYCEAINLGGDLDNGCEREDFDNLTDEQYNKAKEIYDNCRCYDDTETIIKFLEVLYPDDKFKTCVIRGYVQGDWNNVIYKANVTHDINLLEAYYFGEVTEIFDEEGATAVVTDDDLYKAKHEGRLKDLCYDLLDIDKEEEIKIYEDDGYITTIKWKEVE